MKNAVTAASPKPQAAPEPALPVALRRYLYFTAAMAGAAVMVVEILGAKMLSPFLGLSHFVWIAQITVTLISLACGYYAGGRLADRTPRLAVLYWAIFAGAIYLGLTVLICEPVAYWCLDLSSMALGSLLASTVLFFVPLALLAMTCPFLVRVITSSIVGVGSNVGRLSSISTLGSVVGSLLIGYFLVPALPNSITMYLTALALMLVCAGYFVGFGRQALGSLALLVVAGSALGVPISLSKSETLPWLEEKYRGNSHFGQLQVVDRRDGSCRYYLNDYLIQNTYDPQRKQSESHFTYMLSGLARAYVTNISDVLCIGLGVGVVPMDFARQGARVDVVEINPAVVPVAVRYFNLEPDRLHITFDDGRHYLNRCQKRYDAVILDAFLGDSSPSQLLTREAFTAMRKVLRPGGALVINSFGNLEERHDFFTASLHKTLKAVFPGVRLHTSGDGGMFFAATDRTEPVFVHTPDLQDVHPKVQQETRFTYYNLVDTNPQHGLLLTDNYNPAEYYDAANREDIRRRLAKGFKDR